MRRFERLMSSKCWLVKLLYVSWFSLCVGQLASSSEDEDPEFPIPFNEESALTQVTKLGRLVFSFFLSFFLSFFVRDGISFRREL